MGVYTSGSRIGNRTRPNNIKLGAARGYSGDAGLHQLLIENAQNDMALFEGVISSDFQLTSAVLNEATAGQINAINEGFASGLIEKITTFLKTAYEKIKGLILTFIKKLSTLVIRDNKKLVDTHRAAVLRKDLSKMPYKWSVCKSGKDSVLGPVGTSVNEFTEIAENYGKKQKLDTLTVANAIAISKNDDKFNREDAIKEFETATGLKYDDMNKSMRENLFEDKEDFEGLSSALLSNIMETLSTSKKELKALKDIKNKVDKVFKARLSELKNIDNKLSGNIGKDMKVGSGEINKEEVTSALRGINVIFDNLKFTQEATAKTIGASINVFKFKISEARSVFSRAVTFSGVSEDADYREPDQTEIDNDYVDDVEGTDEVNEDVDELDSIEDLDVDSSDAYEDEEYHNESEEEDVEMDDLDSMEDIRSELVEEESDAEEVVDREDVDVEDEDLLDAVDECAANRMEELFEGAFAY